MECPPEMTGPSRAHVREPGALKVGFGAFVGMERGHVVIYPTPGDPREQLVKGAAAYLEAVMSDDGLWMVDDFTAMDDEAMVNLAACRLYADRLNARP